MRTKKHDIPPLNHLLPAKEDRVAFQKLVQRFRVREHAPAAIIGAGLSRPLNYPIWNELLGNLSYARDQVDEAKRLPAPPS